MLTIEVRTFVLLISVSSIDLHLRLLYFIVCLMYIFLVNTYSITSSRTYLSRTVRYQTSTESQALNATQGHKRSYQNPATNTVLWMPHKDTSLAIKIDIC